MVVFLRYFTKNHETRVDSLQSAVYGNSPWWCSVCANPGLISSVFTRFVRCRASHSTFSLSPPRETLGPKHRRLFTRVRRSRFPQRRPTTLHLQIPPTLLPPVCSACAERRRSRFTPCLVLSLHESCRLKINCCHYLGRCSPELCVHSLIIYCKWPLIFVVVMIFVSHFASSLSSLSHRVCSL